MELGRRAWWYIGGSVALLALSGVLLFVFTRGSGDPLEVANPVQSGRNGTEAPSSADAEYVVIGGVRRRRSEVHRSDVSPRTDNELDRTVSDDEDYGRNGFGTIPAVAIDANPQTAAVGKILREEKDLDRLSALGRVAPFDPESYQKDPQAYLNTPVPGRAWAPAQPGEGVRQIASLSPSYQMLQQGESVSLSVAGEPGAPVTFTSLDAGEFQNKLSTITVETNEQGIAQATYSATPGVIYEVRILAASPVMAGQSRWTVQVQPPNEGGPS